MEGVAVPALQTKVPVTAVTGPGVPLELLPFRTNPSTSKDVFPLERLTRACPLRTDQGPAPAWMPATGLSTAGAVITPTMLFQRTKVAFSTQANADVAHKVRGSSTANTLFIFRFYPLG
jgi:hypothetical protein